MGGDKNVIHIACMPETLVFYSVFAFSYNILHKDVEEENCHKRPAFRDHAQHTSHKNRQSPEILQMRFRKCKPPKNTAAEAVLAEMHENIANYSVCRACTQQSCETRVTTAHTAKEKSQSAQGPHNKTTRKSCKNPTFRKNDLRNHAFLKPPKIGLSPRRNATFHQK